MSPKHFEFGPFLKRVYCAAFLEFVMFGNYCGPISSGDGPFDSLVSGGNVGSKDEPLNLEFSSLSSSEPLAP